MALGFRATVLVAFTLVSAALVGSSAALGDTPEWQRDLDYLTWDRRAEGANAAAGGPVYLQPEGQRTAAVSNAAPAPTWQLRVRDFYSIVTPRGFRSMWSRGEETQGAPATLTVPAPGLAVEQPVGAVARRNELPMHGSIVR